MSGSATEIAGYRVGEPIPLEDFLALVCDGVDYDRDETGRLALMAPDHPDFHRLPLGLLDSVCKEQLPRTVWTVLQEPGIALPVVRTLSGQSVAESSLGPKQLEPDLVVFQGRPRSFVRHPGEVPALLPERLQLVVELLSPSTFRHDLGLGQADQVDRWRSYWESEVPEYWILNPGFEGLPLPPRTGLFLVRGDSGWEALPSQGLRHEAAEVHGLRSVTGGVVRSSAVEGLELDLDGFWAELAQR